MANVLIVAEKISVGKAIADAIGLKTTEKRNGYMEGYSDFFGCTVWVTWCVGHLLQMYYPGDYDPKYEKWNLQDLPILPSEYKYKVIPETGTQFQIVARLMNSVGDSQRDKDELSTLSADKKFLVPSGKPKRNRLCVQIRY